MRSIHNDLSILFVMAIPLVHPIGANAEGSRFLFGVSTPVAELNTENLGERGASLTADGLEVFFARATQTNSSNLEIYTARRTSSTDAFGTPVRIEELVAPLDYSNGTPGISADGLTIYFGRGLLDYSSDDEWKESQRIFVATRSSRDVPFSAPTELSTLATEGITSPDVSTDGLSLYAKVSPLGRFDADIYVSRRPDADHPWGPAEPITEFSTTDHWESHPAVSANSLNLFFENWGINSDDYDYRGGLGDIAVAFRSAVNQTWSRPFNLGDTINTGQFDTHPFLTADGSTLYFSHLGNDGPIPATADIYQAPVLDFTTKSLAGDGDSHAENFDSLGTDASQPFSPIPAGWTFTAKDVVFNNVTTRSFPATSKTYAGVYNAGSDNSADRALVTDVSNDEHGELNFRALVTDSSLQAIRLGFDIEAWQVRNGVGNSLGEAAFHVVLEADSGEGFEQVADLGEFSTGNTLQRPAAGSLVDGNDVDYRATFDTGPIDLDVPTGATLRVRWIGTDSSRNVVFGLDNVSLRFAAPGDANIDGIFNSTDLIDVLAIGEYEDTVAGNSTWSEGDWTNDNEFESGDLIAAMADGRYAFAATAAVPEPSISVIGIIGAVAIVIHGNRRK